MKTSVKDLYSKPIIKTFSTYSCNQNTAVCKAQLKAELKRSADQ